MMVRGTEPSSKGRDQRQARGSVGLWALAIVTVFAVAAALLAVKPWRSSPAPSAPEVVERDRDPIAVPAVAEPATALSSETPAEGGPGAQEIVVWETRDGTLHLGDDPPAESHALGKLTAHDARALGAVRSEAKGKPAGPDLSELTKRIREDTGRRPISDASGDPTWSVNDIRGIVVSGDALDVSTDWITNPTMIRVARKLCRYVSGQGDTYDAATVVVRGRQGRILARCKAWG